MSVSLVAVARDAPNQLFTGGCFMRAARCQRWVLGGGSGSVRVPRVAAAGPRIATAARKKTLENEILRQVPDLVQQKLDLVQQKKTVACVSRRLPDLQRAAVDLVIQRADAWLSDGPKAAEFAFVGSPLLPNLAGCRQFGCKPLSKLEQEDSNPDPQPWQGPRGSRELISAIWSEK